MPSDELMKELRLAHAAPQPNTAATVQKPIDLPGQT
jgi:hypothetical protein